MNQNFNTNIVQVMDNEPSISHRIIAEHTENSQVSVRKLIDKHIDKMELFGKVSFEMTAIKNSKNRVNKEKTYFLNEPQATLLLTFLRNNELVIDFKVILVREFFKMRVKLEYKDVDLQSIRERTELIESSAKQFIAFEDIFHRIGITRKEELAITSNRAVAKETGVDFIELAELKGISTPEKYFTVTELCQKVMDSDKFSDESKKLLSTKAGDKPRPQNLNKILESNGFQTKIDGIWKPTEKAKDLSDFVQNKSKYSEKTVFHTVWKMEVLDKIF